MFAVSSAAPPTDFYGQLRSKGLPTIGAVDFIPPARSHPRRWHSARWFWGHKPCANPDDRQQYPCGCHLQRCGNRSVFSANRRQRRDLHRNLAGRQQQLHRPGRLHSDLTRSSDGHRNRNRQPDLLWLAGRSYRYWDNCGQLPCGHLDCDSDQELPRNDHGPEACLPA
jgi:hypothetical protein